MNYVFEATNEPTFQEREKVSNRMITIFAIIIAIIFSAITSHIVFGIFAAVLIIVIQKVKSKNHNRFFLKRMEINDGSVNITFYLNEELKTVSGTIQDFEVYKRFTVERVSVAYLVINFKDGLLLKQHLIYPWSEKRFDEILSTFLALKANIK